MSEDTKGCDACEGCELNKLAKNKYGKRFDQLCKDRQKIVIQLIETGLKYEKK